ncbi:IDEAL domain-containing protein [Bacillus licheniformis]|uniref:IDEAL domain-containing protein n=1 Tax=Bacillus licheniformis TaxID=1402 RepID=UPI002282A6E1|nr:IDEAL domain-containing protein [Bacillus licheniformis]MCY7773498.1 IDEAL domain-containing protein [Bacillus licheniformis]MCY7954362.1 IDEAL domain-containing protein [Bacillus licheniformis]MCY8157904.1 IDEAL domain-containing protein [Bacillus licheniformis]MCY8527601.1 IDEAL domain-containing protein [Bacillus licheniformis]MCY8745900.1 IDEAL domain-containing protein [Bacillus licheniformis]
MKEKKSYAELMKSRNTQKVKELDVTITDIYIQMVLDESLFKRRLNTLSKKINEALDKGDKQSFLELSREYTALKKHA